MKLARRIVDILFVVAWLAFGGLLVLSVVRPIGKMDVSIIPQAYSVQCAVLLFLGVVTVIKAKIFPDTKRQGR